MKTVVVATALVVIIVTVIIVNAPPPDSNTAAGRLIPIANVFAILEMENDAVRELWTKQIVGAGQEIGLKFDKDWREQGVEAGPLPALFLRETAESLRRNPVPLYLFLGSDFPINEANKFTGLQTTYFNEIRRTGEPQFFSMMTSNSKPPCSRTSPSPKSVSPATTMSRKRPRPTGSWTTSWVRRPGPTRKRRSAWKKRSPW